MEDSDIHDPVVPAWIGDVHDALAEVGTAAESGVLAFKERPREWVGQQAGDGYE